MPEGGQKIYVLDTSVLLHDPGAIDSFKNNVVVIPIWVIEELDKNKEHSNGKGAAAREVSRRLIGYKSRGSLKSGVATDAGGTLFIDYRGIRNKKMPVRLEDTYDNRIIAVAYQWHESEQRGQKRKVVLVSKDSNVLLKASACGLDAQDYEADKKIHSIGELYTGRVTMQLEQDDTDICGRFYRDRILPADSILPYAGGVTPPANACCEIVTPSGKRCYAIYKESRAEFVHVTLKGDRRKIKGAVAPKNIEQEFAYRLIADPEIPLVSLVGRAGTGKTLIALLAGYNAELAETYDQLAVYRPNIEIGRPLGFLPGDIKEKFGPWAHPIFDNLELILGDAHQNGKDRGVRDDIEHANGKHGMGARYAIEELLRNSRLDISPINFLRGRSLHHQIVIVDEAQNLTPHEIKTVLTGDPYQIDNPYLDAVSNGLSYAVERLRGNELFGHITMEKTERSSLAELAARVL